MLTLDERPECENTRPSMSKRTHKISLTTVLRGKLLPLRGVSETRGCGCDDRPVFIVTVALYRVRQQVFTNKKKLPRCIFILNKMTFVILYLQI